ncbi:MAG TPA: aldo/keto reductase, partial [Kribbella sp.]
MTSSSTDDWLRPLGSTGLTVSAVCAGGAVLAGMPEVFGYDVSPVEAIAVIRGVLDSPLRWIDTSNGYGDGESELRIGQALAEHGGLPDDFLVATKVDADGNDYSAARVRASVAESKRRLGLDQLPLVYLHDPEFHDFDSMRGAVGELMRLREEGEIGHVGLAGG